MKPLRWWLVAELKRLFSIKILRVPLTFQRFLNDVGNGNAARLVNLGLTVDATGF